MEENIWILHLIRPSPGLDVNCVKYFVCEYVPKSDALTDAIIPVKKDIDPFEKCIPSSTGWLLF